jgi:hypothetical protein
MVPADALRSFNALLTKLLGGIADKPRGALVEVGSVLYMMERAAHKALETVKGNLRAQALRSHPEPGTVHWNGSGRGTVDITIPAPFLKVRKGADLKALRGIIGEDFDDLFETVTTYKLRKGAGDRLSDATAETRQAVMGACELVDGTPRVSFKRK